MSSNLPIPLPPRTPTPPTPLPDDRPSPSTSFKSRPGSIGLGLGLHHHNDSVSSLTPSIQEHHDYDYKSGINDSRERTRMEAQYVDRGPESGKTDSTASMLSPESATFSISNGGLSPANAIYSPLTPQTASTDGGFGNLDVNANGNTVTNPFNFTPVQYERSPSISSLGGAEKKLVGRRGHKYRHSSIHASHMEGIIKPPQASRTPLSVPASLPMPTRKEAWWSMTKQQTTRLTWCICHFLVAGYVQFSGAGSLAMTALSRLLLFDAAGATVCVVVDVMGNFEVWKRSSIKHPFGLERADVLAGFGMAVFIGFMGLDVISHGIQHSLENLGTHVAHSPHAHERVGTAHVDFASLLSIASTLVSAVLLKNHARMGKAMRVGLLAGWGKILGNPSHFLTLSCSLAILLLPFLTTKYYAAFDFALSLVIACFMVLTGTRLGSSLSSMLLMSARSPAEDKYALRDIADDVANCDPSITNVDEARFWQVHYGSGMANLKLRYRKSRGGYGMTDDLTRVRQNVTKLIQRRLAGLRWEVSIQLSVETD
ncbi:Putative cation efflux protein [Septoria linicola]|uniref:Zinc transporter n=1 Tax=Septoria linicola TaxID=215465 RepID=A0A9Q9ATR6_9PEZI|nr:putative cation efflux protein [Septoria linicola]USW55264.1 Putative cation efflux protein [Septoria linicola]